MTAMPRPGAKLVPFAGWEMPVQYAGIREEHLAVRTRAGVFDVSHMGQVETSGPQALEFLQRLLSNDVRRMPEGGAQYSLLCREDGGVIDDLFTYRLSDNTFLTVTNAANHEKDLAWLRAHADGFDVDVLDRAADFAMLAVQGPKARELVRGLADGSLPGRFRVCERTVAGARDARVRHRLHRRGRGRAAARPRRRAGVWDAIIAGRRDARSASGARDTLRLEVCFHLYGNDLDEGGTRSRPAWGGACRERTGFIGSEAVAAARREGPREKLVPFAIEGQGIARQGNPVVGGGEVTSGTFSPCLERGIGMAYVSSARADAGTQIEIDVRGRVRPRRDQRKPLYRKEA